MKIVSVAVHENEAAIVDKCLNAVVVGGFDAVILHVNKAAALDEARLGKLLRACPTLVGRVEINPDSAALTPVKTHWFVSDLHLAHVRNFRFADRTMPFEWFSLDASNTLLLRRGVYDYLSVYPGVEKTGTHAAWEWWPFVRRDPIWPILQDRLIHGHHEGSFYTHAMFERICNDIQTYEDQLAKLREENIAPEDFPREEIVIPGLFYSYDINAVTKVPYIWLRWDTRLNWHVNEVAQVLEGKVILPPGRYGIKRVARTIDDPLRTLVGKAFGYRSELESACKAVLG